MWINDDASVLGGFQPLCPIVRQDFIKTFSEIGQIWIGKQLATIYRGIL